MDILFSILGGISAKIYDDMSDNGLLTNKLIEELLKGSQWVFLTLISHNDFNFTSFIFFINFLNLITNWNAWYDYEISLQILYVLFIPLSFSTRKQLSFVDMLYILCFSICMGLEPLIITEEYSQRKFLFRSITTLVIYIGLFVGHYNGVSWSLLKVGMYSLGYALVSSIFQLYMLTQNNDNILQTLVLHS